MPDTRPRLTLTVKGRNLDEVRRLLAAKADAVLGAGRWHPGRIDMTPTNEYSDDVEVYRAEMTVIGANYEVSGL